MKSLHGGKDKLTCTFCDKIFSQEDQLNLHIKEVHVAVGVKPFKCTGNLEIYPSVLNYTCLGKSCGEF